MSSETFLQIFSDRTDYAMTSVSDYNAILRVVGGVLLTGLLLRATVSKSQFRKSTMGELQTVTSCKRVRLIKSTV